MSTSSPRHQRRTTEPDAACSAGDDFCKLAEAARAGCAQATARLLDQCRNYLLLIANSDLGSDLQGKVGASDLVQETLLAAQQDFKFFMGGSQLEMRLWLRRILTHKLYDVQRAYRGTHKRNIAKEQPLDDLGENGAQWYSLTDPADTPRRKAIASEQSLAVTRVLEELPEHYQEVIRRRCYDLQPFSEIGLALGVSSEAARKLFCRAIERLREQWDLSDESC